MIEFKGIISDKCASHMRNRETMLKLRFCLPLGIALAIPFAIDAISNEPISWVVVVAFLLFGFIGAVPPSKKDYATYLPNSVIIEGNSIAISCENLYQSREVEQVKKVIDFGEWYQIVFAFPHKSLYFICQKDLLVKGTLEDFEGKFKGLIVHAK